MDPPTQTLETGGGGINVWDGNSLMMDIFQTRSLKVKDIGE